ncbi:MAG: fdhC [Verrucomicrobiaceae bacterium]|nr:fdhC [Verrucomicrobiaceae bacterium]
MKKRTRVLPIIAFALVAGSALHSFADTKPNAATLARGKYLVSITGCNDCHTAGYTMVGGQVPVNQWLAGSDMGWRGPWGTTYATNLRLYMQTISEEQWVTLAHSAQMRPPMPWFALHDLNERDLRDIFRFVRALGATGKPAPDFVPPGQTPQGPFVQFPMPPK